MRSLSAAGKERDGCAFREASVSLLLVLSAGLTLPAPSSVLFCSSSPFHRPTLSSPAPLQATVLVTWSRVDGRTGLCCLCEHRSLSAFIPVSCDRDLPVSLV